MPEFPIDSMRYDGPTCRRGLVRRALWRVLGVAFLVGCAAAPPAGPVLEEAQIGLASYYADRFQGRRTASGERYDREAFTAAHRRLPFGAVVQVTNVANGRSVEVRINDRGPYVAGRVIDLSHAAARQLGMLREGVVRVRIVRRD